MEDLLKQVLVLDTECTHADPNLAEIVELATCDRQRSDWCMQSTLFGSIAPMPPEASAVTHISNRMIQDLPVFGADVDDLHHMLDTAHTWFVAHNAQYDRQVLTKHLAPVAPELADKFAQTDRWICTLRLARHAYPEAASYAQNYLRYWLNLPVDDHLHAHRAGADSVVCAHLLERITTDMITQGLIMAHKCVGTQLVTWSQAPIKIVNWPFGKHKGKQVQDLETDYLLWAIDNLVCFRPDHAEHDVDLTESVRQVLEQRI